MKITIEMIDELKKRANVSFENAKEALEKCDGDLVEALVYLEKNNKAEFEGVREKQGFFHKIKALIRKGNNIRFIVSKKGRTILNISLTVAILIGIFTFHISIIALVIALFTGYKFRFEKNNGEDMKVNDMVNKVHDNVDNFKKKFDEDVSTEK